MADEPQAGWRTLMVRGFAQLLAAEGVMDWSESQAYDLTATAAFLSSMPTNPDRAAVLTAYDLGADAVGPGDTVTGLQIRTRWAGANPNRVRDFSDAIYATLHGRRGFTLPTGVTIAQCRRLSSASLGQESSTKRWLWTDNYSVELDVPAPHRL